MRKAVKQIPIIVVVYFITIVILFFTIRKDIASDLFMYSVLPFCMAIIGLIKGSEGKRMSDPIDFLTEETQKMVKLSRFIGIVIFIMSCVLSFCLN